ncbi:MAG: bifunctional diguanylate cyclase/phosphodiesterase [Sandaracinaceae bacterium]
MDLVRARPIGWELLSPPSAGGRALTEVAALGPPRHLLFLPTKVERLACAGPGSRPPDPQALGLEPERVVLQVSERESRGHPGRFVAALERLAERGQTFAIDHFGAGQTGVATLLEAVPAYLKLDRSFVAGIAERPARQRALRSLLILAEDLGVALIARDVRTMDEVEALADLGLRLVQGPALAGPAPVPEDVPTEVAERIRRFMHAQRWRLGALDEHIGALVEEAPTVAPGTLTVAEVEARFRHIAQVDHAVVVVDGRPVGLLTRNDLYARTAGPFGYALMKRKPAEDVAKPAPTVVPSDLPVTEASERAMARPRDDLYDPVVVVDDDGRLVGTVTMKAIITRSIEVEVQTAKGSNPLTGLPGNHRIEAWIRSAFDLPDFAIVYADLDRFKEFNDRYGFLLGDEMIRLAAKVLAEGRDRLGPEASLGHIGGDDFVLVCPDGASPGVLDRVCADFDEQKARLFDAEDLARGAYRASDRRGRTVEIPLVTLSLSCIARARLGPDAHPALLSQIAASLKKKVKEITARERKSAWMEERRQYGG